MARHSCLHVNSHSVSKPLDSPASTVTRSRAGRPGFDSRQGTGFFFSAIESRPALEPTQPPSIKNVPVTVSPGVKRPGRETDHSPPYSAQDKNAWSYTSIPQYVYKAWNLIKHRGIYNLYITLPSVMSWWSRSTLTSRHCSVSLSRTTDGKLYFDIVTISINSNCKFMGDKQVSEAWQNYESEPPNKVTAYTRMGRSVA
jgi:hypothetical protein